MNRSVRPWDQRLRAVLALDLRTLALFRAAVALLLLGDALRGLAHAGVWYSDDGIVPRSWITATGADWRWSLHLVGGETLFPVLLLLAEAAAALALLLGLRTRRATLVLWVLAASLAARNPLLLTGGDVLLLGLLFWGLFLPLGARWSVDHALAGDAAPLPRVPSWAAAGMLLQLFSVLWFQAAFLAQSPIPPAALNTLLTPLGERLFAATTSATLLARLGWWTLCLVPVAALSPLGRTALRTAALIALILLALSLMLATALDHDAHVLLAGATLLVDAGLWDRLARRRARRPGSRLRIHHDSDCGFCRRGCLLLRELLLLDAEVRPVQDSARARALREANDSWVVFDRDDSAHLRWDAFVVLLRRSPLLAWLAPLAALAPITAAGERLYARTVAHRAALGRRTAFLEPPPRRPLPRVAPIIAGLALAATLLWNLSTLGWLPQAGQRLLHPLVSLLQLEQRWDVIGAAAGAAPGWYAAPGVLADGREADLLRGRLGAPDLQRPAHANLRSFRWQAYEQRLLDPALAGYRQHWGDYLCRRWNRGLAADSPQRAVSLRLIYLLNTGDDRAPRLEQQVLRRQTCAAPDGR